MAAMADNTDYIRRKMAGESADNEAGSLARRSRLERLQPDKVRFDLTWDNIQIEQPIGFGGFSQVFRVQLAGDPERDYALKCLNPQTKLHTKTFKTGAVDLAIEGEILSRLEHENVIGIHGICGGGCMNAYVDSDRGYFIVLDLLEDTLSSKLEKYRKIYKSKSSAMSNSRTASSSRSSNSKHMSQSAVLERVGSVAMGVAKGMEYLHSQGVALRDLKPDNIGFDEHGTPKIFDLGFAREAHTIKPTEVAGSLRYMAPEVARGFGSELASDVYSFGVLLWEICTLEKPYKHINSRDDFMRIVVMEEWRHTTSKIPSSSLRKIIKECWLTDSSKRPTFSQIVKKLRVELSLSKAATAAAAVPNKGFGSGVNLKRTATWTAKKFTNGISSSGLGVLRLGFKSSNSFSKNSEATAATDSSASTIEQRAQQGRSKSPKAGRNATFGLRNSGGRRSNPMFQQFQMQNEVIAEDVEQQPTTKPTKMRHALPSCPQITGAAS
jgi:serine/threonine protein kinase